MIDLSLAARAGYNLSRGQEKAEKQQDPFAGGEPQPKKQASSAMGPLPTKLVENKAAPTETLLGQLADYGLSGLAKVGNFLDVPGSMVRDLATWVPGGIEGQNPFDQLATPFSSENRISGEDMLKSAGLAGEDTWGGLIGGIGLEIALDPLTYLTLGSTAVGKTGAAAAKAGLTKGATKTANKIAARELGEQGGRQLGKTASRMTLTPRDLIDDFVDETKLAQEFSKVDQELGQQYDKVADSIRSKGAASGADKKAIEDEVRSAFLERDDKIRQARQVAEDAVRAESQQAAMERFRIAGGTDEMLDEKLGAIAKFKIPFLSDALGEKYPILRERLIGTTDLTPGELASKPWFNRSVEAAAAAGKAPGPGDRGPDGPDIGPGPIDGGPLPGGPAAPQAGPDMPSGPQAGPDIPEVPQAGPSTPEMPTSSKADAAKPKRIKSDIAKEFSAKSPAHRKMDKDFESMRDAGILDDADADVLRLAFRDADLSGYEKVVTRVMPDIPVTRAQREAFPDAKDIIVGGRARPDIGGRAEIEMNARAFEKGSILEGSGAEKLVHELFHAFQYTKEAQLREGGIEIIPEFKRIFKKSSVENYFNKNYTPDEARYYLSKPEEAFTQMATDSLLRRHVPPEEAKPILERAREFLIAKLDQVRKAVGLSTSARARADLLFDVVSGHKTPEEYIEAYLKTPAKPAPAAIEKAVEAGKRLREELDSKKPTKESISAPAVDPVPSPVDRLDELREAVTGKAVDEAVTPPVAKSPVDRLGELREAVTGKAVDEAVTPPVAKSPVDRLGELRDAVRGSKSQGIVEDLDDFKPRDPTPGDKKLKKQIENLDEEGVLNAITSTTFRTMDDAEAAAELMDARLEELRQLGVASDSYFIARVKEVADGFEIETVDPRAELRSSVKDMVRLNQAQRAAATVKSESTAAMEASVSGMEFPTEAAAADFARSLNARLDDGQRAGYSFVAKTGDDGKNLVELVEVPDILPDDVAKFDPASLVRSGDDVEARLDSMEEAADAAFGGRRASAELAPSKDPGLSRVLHPAMKTVDGGDAADILQPLLRDPQRLNADEVARLVSQIDPADHGKLMATIDKVRPDLAVAAGAPAVKAAAPEVFESLPASPIAEAAQIAGDAAEQVAKGSPESMASKLASHAADQISKEGFILDPDGFRSAYSELADKDKIKMLKDLAKRGAVGKIFGRKRKPPTGTEVMDEIRMTVGKMKEDFDLSDAAREMTFEQSPQFSKLRGEDSSYSLALQGSSTTTDTPNFKRWFGKSKIVDESGKPMVVYHGTRAAFDSFDTPTDGLINHMMGPHFAKDPSVTDAFTIGAYARDSSAWSATPENGLLEGLVTESGYKPLIKPGGNVKPVYLKIENPYKIPDHGGMDQTSFAIEAAGKVMRKDKEAAIEMLQRSRAMTLEQAEEVYSKLAKGEPFVVNGDRVTQARIDKFGGDAFKAYADNFGFEFGPKVGGLEWNQYVAKRFKEILKEEGYDGIEYKNTSGNEVKAGADPTAYIPFDGNQIKSATGNSGEFSNASDDIRYALGIGGAQVSAGMAKAAKAVKEFSPSGAYEKAKEIFGKTRDGLELGKKYEALKQAVADGDIAPRVGAAMDTVGGIIRYNPASRIMMGALDVESMGAVTKNGQEISQMVYAATEEATAAVRRKLYEPAKKVLETDEFNFEKLVEKHGGDIGKARSEQIESMLSVIKYLERADDLLAKGSEAVLPPNLLHLEEPLNVLRGALNDIVGIEQGAGLKSKLLNDLFVAYLPRREHRFPGMKGSSSNLGKLHEVGTPYQLERYPFLKDLPGGTASINRMSIDDMISGKSAGNASGKATEAEVGDAVKYLKDTYGGGKPGQRTNDELFPLEMDDREQRLRSLAKWLLELDPRHAELGIPIFQLDPVTAVMNRVEAGMHAAAAANLATRHLTGAAKPIREMPGGVLMTDAMEKLAKDGMDSDRLVDIMSTQLGDAFTSEMKVAESEAFDGIKSRMASKLGIRDKDRMLRTRRMIPEDQFDATPPESVMVGGDLVEWVGNDGSGNAIIRYGDNSYDQVPLERLSAPKPTPKEVLKRFTIDADTAEDVFRYMKGFAEPEYAQKFLDTMRSITNLYKAGYTVVWPAFHVRNFISGQYNNWVGEAFDPAYKNASGAMQGNRAYWQPIKDADALFRGKNIERALEIPAIKAKGIANEAEAMEELRKLIFQYKLIDFGQGISGDVVGQDLGSLRAQMVGGDSVSMKDILMRIPPPPPGSTKLDRMNPLGGAGMFGQESDTFGLYRYGRQVGHYVEGLNRIAPFLAYLRQGIDPAVAAKKVFELQFDYTRNTPVERYARVLFPFWSYTKNIVPFTIKNLIEHPGGKMAQTIRVANSSRSKEPMPDYISGTAAIPFGKRGSLAEGDKAFLTGLGLGFEDPLSMSGFITGDPADGFRNVLSRTNPLLKGPLELAFGESTYFDGPGGGRSLKDMDPTYGRILANITDAVTGEDTIRAEPIFGSPLAEQVLSNLPTSRVGTTIRTLTDDRKWKNPAKLALNLGTGLRVSDISQASWDAAVQDLIQERLKEMGGREFIRPYMPEYVAKRLDEGQLTEAEAMEETLQWLAERTKQRKAEREAAAAQ